MSENSLITTKYNDVEFSLGNFSNKSVFNFLEKIGELVRDPWDKITVKIEIENLKVIIDKFNLKIENIDFSKVNKITVLEILRAASKNKHLNLEDPNNVYEAWKSLFEKLKSKGKNLDLDNILRYTEILDKLNNDDLSALKEIYFDRNLSFKFFENGVLDRIADLNLVCYTQYNKYLTAGKKYASNIQDFEITLPNIQHLRILPNNQTLDFIRYLFDNEYNIL